MTLLVILQKTAMEIYKYNVILKVEFCMISKKDKLTVKVI